ECWQTQSYPYPAAIELAKLLEHQARDPSAARRIVSDALGLLVFAAVPNPQWRTDLERRLGRLDRRLGPDAARAFALTGWSCWARSAAGRAADWSAARHSGTRSGRAGRSSCPSILHTRSAGPGARYRRL